MILKPARLLVALLAFAAVPVMAQNIAVVNGKPIPSSRLDAMVKQMSAQGQQDTPQLRNAIKEELINREVLLQEAEKQGIPNNADVKSQLDMARQSILMRGLVASHLAKNPVSESELKAEYERYKAIIGDKEYHARHILVQTEDEAKAIIAKLKSGSKFEDLAKQSKDPGSAANGGDLDWVAPASFVKPFADALVKLKKGEMTETPVQTQFGYHVIKLEDTRPAKVATLEEMKPQLTEVIQQGKLQAFQQDLRSKAKVQ
jgi:peptidyl-prolyl cis-trans isomerase C